MPTPGPWAASHCDGKFGEVPGWMVTHPGASEVRRRTEAKDFPITSKKICDVTEGAYIAPNTAAANARLIAAAPDHAIVLRGLANLTLRWETFDGSETRGELCYNGVRHTTTTDEFGCPQLTDALRSALVEGK